MKIIDNVNSLLRDDLAVAMQKNSKVAIAASYFSIYAFQELKAQLKDIDELKFIFTSLDKDSKYVHTMFEKFLESLLEEQGNRLVIFIDELDRCKPSYAVSLLERIKHYFTNDRITFVFSININELRHTIKQYYGNDFNSCKYIDRFFDLRISLPPANLQKYYESIGFNNTALYDEVISNVIDTYHFELREIAKFVRLAKIAAHEPTHDEKNSRFLTEEQEALLICLNVVVPIIIGLKIGDITRYNSFIKGDDCSPIIEILKVNRSCDWICRRLLEKDETYDVNETDKTKVTIEEKIMLLYNALFINKFDGRSYEVNVGKLTFNKDTRMIILRTASLLSKYTKLDV